MSLTNDIAIAFGPGGLIRADEPANRELLAQIDTTLPLSPEYLLKLAAFYVEYPTNVPLGNHLALIALTKLVNDSYIHQVLISRTSPAAIASLQDFFEDLWDGGIDESKEPPFVGEPDVWSIPFSGVGLLIETGIRDTKGKYYAIGVGPVSLPDEP
jgi:hypothetical protein